MSNKTTFTIGADPEVFIFNKETQNTYHPLNYLKEVKITQLSLEKRDLAFYAIMLW